MPGHKEPTQREMLIGCFPKPLPQRYVVVSIQTTDKSHSPNLPISHEIFRLHLRACFHHASWHDGIGIFWCIAVIFEHLNNLNLDADGSMSTSAGRNFISENAYEDVISQMKDLSVEAAGKGTSKKELNGQCSLFYDIMECIEWMKLLVLKVLKRQLFLLNMSHLLPMLSLQLHKIVPLFLTSLHMVTATYPLMQLSSTTIFSLEFTSEDPTRWRDFMALGKMRRPLRRDGYYEALI